MLHGSAVNEISFEISSGLTYCPFLVSGASLPPPMTKSRGCEQQKECRVYQEMVVVGSVDELVELVVEGIEKSVSSRIGR